MRDKCVSRMDGTKHRFRGVSTFKRNDVIVLVQCEECGTFETMTMNSAKDYVW